MKQRINQKLALNKGVLLTESTVRIRLEWSKGLEIRLKKGYYFK